jgi:sortase A
MAVAERKKSHWRAAILVLLFCVVWQWGNAAWIYAKAYLARHWIAQAWQGQLHNPSARASHKPWPWADTWPVARLQWLSGDTVRQDLYVLAGAHGSALAFGPGHLDGTAEPGEGAAVIGGHRDTHFAFLQYLQKNALLRVQTRQGEWKHYRVRKSWVADSRTQPLLIAPDSQSLWLVTCYPFDEVVPGGPLRFVVYAELTDKVSDGENLSSAFQQQSKFAKAALIF